jgi:hypothetical protein
MSGGVLDRLLSEDLQAKTCAYSTATGLALLLAQRPEASGVRQALRDGALSEEAVRDWIASLLKGLRPGVLFPHDGTLAALAVACAGPGTTFGEAVLRKFAELKLAEIPLAPRVARHFLQQRPVGPGSSPVERVTGPGQASTQPEPAHPAT